MGFQTNNTDHLIRSQIWSGDVKRTLQDELMGMKYVKMINGFPDGDTVNIPSIGQALAKDYVEGQPITYSAMDTGNFQFSLTDYKYAALAISNKMKQDSFYMSQLMAEFGPAMARTLAAAMEEDVLAIGPDNQTASDLNAINGGNHRFVASGTNDVMTVNDFAKALHALRVANVPLENLVAIVDPSVEYTINTLTNITNVSNNPRWEGVLADGIGKGNRFIKNIFGFDVYVSNRLKSGISETINSNAVTNGVANLFFSASPEVLPFVGLIRQAPTVESKYNMDLQQDEYLLIARWGFDLFRPENLVTVISDKVQALA